MDNIHHWEYPRTHLPRLELPLTLDDEILLGGVYSLTICDVEKLKGGKYCFDIENVTIVREHDSIIKLLFR